MTIPSEHTPLSRSAKTWLLNVSNPLMNGLHARSPLSAMEVPMVLRAAELHGVLPQVLKALKAHKVDGGGGTKLVGRADEIQSAEKAIVTARGLQLRQTGLELLLTHHGTRIIGALADSRVPASIVKGPIFARRLYKVAAMRPFSDIDILLSPEHRPLAGDIMRSLGFDLANQDYRGDEDYFEDKWFLIDNPEITIEVHGDLVHNPRLRQSASVTLDDVLAVGNGNSEDATALLMVAAAHGAISHQFDRLQHLADVALAASGAAGDINIERLRLVSRARRLTISVYAALSVSGRAFANPACERFASALARGAMAKLAASLISVDTVLDARSAIRSRSSWRRKILRQLIRHSS